MKTFVLRLRRRAVTANSAVRNQANRGEHSCDLVGQAGIGWRCAVGRLQNCYERHKEDHVDGSSQSERRNAETEYQGFAGEPRVSGQNLRQERSRPQRSFGV